MNIWMDRPCERDTFWRFVIITFVYVYRKIYFRTSDVFLLFVDLYLCAVDSSNIYIPDDARRMN